MSQTRVQSFIEANTNVFIGFIISYFTGLVIYPCFNVDVHPAKNFGITLCFTVTSIIRQYIIRRYFNNKENEIISSKSSN